MNIDATPNQEASEGSSLMRYPRCLSRLSACEVVRTFFYSQDVIQETPLVYMALNL